MSFKPSFHSLNLGTSCWVCLAGGITKWASLSHTIRKPPTDNSSSCGSPKHMAHTPARSDGTELAMLVLHHLGIPLCQGNPSPTRAISKPFAPLMHHKGDETRAQNVTHHLQPICISPSNLYFLKQRGCYKGTVLLFEMLLASCLACGKVTRVLGALVPLKYLNIIYGDAHNSAFSVVKHNRNDCRINVIPYSEPDSRGLFYLYHMWLGEIIL